MTLWPAPDPQEGLRSFLREPGTELVALLTYPGDPKSPLVYYPRIPSGTAMPRRAIAFRFDGGTPRKGVRITRARCEFRLYGENEDEQMKLERALYRRLHGRTNVLRATAGGTLGLLGFYQDVAVRTGLEDPDTGWRFAHTIYGVTHANDALG